MKILKKSQERTEEDRRELSRMVQEIIDNVRANGGGREEGLDTEE